jgi:hypothetical protein
MPVVDAAAISTHERHLYEMLTEVSVHRLGLSNG